MGEKITQKLDTLYNYQLLAEYVGNSHATTTESVGFP